MYDNKTYVVEKRIVIFSQHWLHSIIRWDVNRPVEFISKLDISLDTYGYAIIRKNIFLIISFKAYVSKI